MLKRSHLPSVLAVVLLFTLSGCKEEGERPAEPGPVLVAPIVAAGKTHSLAVRGDGTVWAWGFNTSGQLGDGTYTFRRTPGQVSGPSGVIALAAGTAHSLAVSGDGTVWSWGDNWRGQLGDGKVSIPRATPLRVAGLSNVLSVAAGEHHSLAVRDDGTVWVWGDNWQSQLGNPHTLTPQPAPVQVAGLSNFTTVAAGQYHSLALRGDGTVWAWGYNRFGQLGDGTEYFNRAAPVQVVGLSNVTALAAGNTHSLAVRDDGTVWAWGDNTYGQLGDGTDTSRRLTPVQVAGLSGITAVAAGASHSLALGRDGTLWAWGGNQKSQLGGEAHSTPRRTPVQVSGLSGITALAAGEGHSLAVHGEGTVWAWGANLHGQLGNGIPINWNTPRPGALTRILTLDAGYRHSLAVRDDGTVWAWGDNTYGQLGAGTDIIPRTPVQVAGLSNVTALAAGEDYSLAARDDGTVWAWGTNAKGQLGDGADSTLHLTPMQVAGLSNVTALAAGSSHSLALRADGTVWAWGTNAKGQLGDGTNTSRRIPEQVAGLSNIIAVAAGSAHSLALRADGTVWAWGDNGYGQLGDGTTTGRSTPMQVAGLSNIVAVATGAEHSLVVRADGIVLAWGNNEQGQLGDEGGYYSTTPVYVPYLARVTAVTAGRYHSMAARDDGSVWAWGINWNGELGDGTYVHHASPAQVPGLSSITALAAGLGYSIALRGDGSLRVWGANSAAQLGEGSASWSGVPMQPLFP